MTDRDFFELLPSPQHTNPNFVTWTSLETSKRSLPLAPDFILGDFPPALARSYFSHSHGSDAGIFTLSDVTVTERGFIRDAGVPVACNYASMSWPLYKQLLDESLIRTERSYRRISVDSAVLLLTIGYDVYGHWLVDFLPKLYILAESGFDIFNLKYLVPDDVMPFGLEWLRLIGLRPEQFIHYDTLIDLVAVKHLILPTMARAAHRALDLFPACASYLMTLLDRQNGPVSSIDSPQRIFVSRARSGRDGRWLTNREEIEELAAKNGFRIIHPETLPIEQQVALFRSAHQIIGEYGSALHGSMFSPAGAAICALRGAAYHPGFLQSGLCQVQRQFCGYVFGSAPIDAVNYGFSIAPEDFKAALDLMQLLH